MSEKKESCVLQLEGGIGKMIAATCLITELKKRYKKVFVFSAYPDIFWGICDRSFAANNVPYAYEDYYQKADDVFFPSPYRDHDFRAHRISLCEAFYKCCGFKYNGELPQLNLKKTEIELAKKIKKDIGSFVIIQFHGGKSPYTANQQNKKNIIVKDYPVDLAEKLVNEIKKKHKVQVVNMHLQNEYPIKGALDIHLPVRRWFALLNEADDYICIDSNLQHAGAALKRPGIVLWGGTDPNMFGYKLHKNIAGDCKNIHCTRPYFVPSSDIVESQIFECPDKKCMEIQPEEIIKHIKISKTIFPPTIELDQHVCKGCNK
jgi:hypothetical protein